MTPDARARPHDARPARGNAGRKSGAPRAAPATDAAPPPSAPSPRPRTPEDAALLAAYAERRAARGAEPPTLDVSDDTAAGKRTVTMQVPVADAELNQAQLAHATGLLELPSQAHGLAALTTVLSGSHTTTDLSAQLNTALALLSELAPRSGLEGLLCTQMIATHEAALVMLGRATPGTQTIDHVDRLVTRAVRLQRVFLEQVAALAKLRGQGGQQTVTVEHVHRHVHVHGTPPASLEPSGAEVYDPPARAALGAGTLGRGEGARDAGA